MNKFHQDLGIILQSHKWSFLSIFDGSFPLKGQLKDTNIWYLFAQCVVYVFIFKRKYTVSRTIHCSHSFWKVVDVHFVMKYIHIFCYRNINMYDYGLLPQTVLAILYLIITAYVQISLKSEKFWILKPVWPQRFWIKDCGPIILLLSTSKNTFAHTKQMGVQ